jgi:hypothetical protein
MQPVSEQRISKHIPSETRRTQRYSYIENGSVSCVVRTEELKLEGQPVKRRLGGWCEMTASLAPSQKRVKGWQLKEMAP